MRLIDADALILYLNDIYFRNSPNGNSWRETLEMKQYREGVCEGLEMAMKSVEEAPTVGGWISVKDRMPEKNGEYLCWFGKNIMAKGAAIATYLEMWKAFGSLESLETYPNVTHWMPIEPPKEEQ